jgi:hypothetical protein
VTANGLVTATADGPNLSLNVVPFSSDPTFLRPLGGATVRWSDFLTFYVGSVVAGLSGNQSIELTPLAAFLPLIHSRVSIDLTDNITTNTSLLNGLVPYPSRTLQFSGSLGNNAFSLSSSSAPYASHGSTISAIPKIPTPLPFYNISMLFSTVFNSYPSGPVPFELSASATATDGDTVS